MSAEDDNLSYTGYLLMKKEEFPRLLSDQDCLVIMEDGSTTNITDQRASWM